MASDLTELLERVSKAAVDISTYAEHDFDCVRRAGDACDCGYTKASNEVLAACAAALTVLGSKSVGSAPLSGETP